MNSLAFLGRLVATVEPGVIARSEPGAGASPPLDVGLDGSGRLRRDCVVVLELEEGIDADRLLPAGDRASIWGRTSWPAGRTGSPWPHPLLAVDAHTIVTGSEEALRQLVARGGDAELASGPMELLLKKLSPGGDLAVMVDLSPPRTAAWKLPANLLDVWPAGKSRWHLLCETPLALGLSVQSADQRRCELGLVCNGETMAEKIRLDVEKLVPDAIQALPAHIAALKEHSPAEEVPGRGGRSIQAAPGRLARGLAHGPLRYGRRHRLACSLAGQGRGSWSRQPRPSRARPRCGPIGWLLPGPSMKAITAACSADCWSYAKAQNPPRISRGSGRRGDDAAAGDRA